jgi:phosphate transport system substrate-binding protein
MIIIIIDDELSSKDSFRRWRNSNLACTPHSPFHRWQVVISGMMMVTQENPMAARHSHPPSSGNHFPSVVCLSLLAVMTTLMLTPAAMAAPGGRILIAGYGPELPIIQDLAKAYEKRYPGTAIDIEWDKALRAVEMVKQGEAQIAVTDRPVPALRTTHIAWDGIAVIVNFANPIREVTTPQVRALFSGQITRWSDLDGSNGKVEVISRTATDNITAGFEASLELRGQLQSSGQPAGSDQKALSIVSGRDTAVSYISLAAALKAQEDGIPIQILTIDKIEPGEPTVQNGRYTLRRPVLLLTGTQSDPLTDSFVTFTQSPEGQRLIRTLYVPLDRPTPTAPPANVRQPERATPAS